MKTLSDYYVGEMYSKTPSSVEFIEDYVKFNPEHTEEKYEQVKALVIAMGQQKPILMLDGKCIDGRHRTRIASELGIDVLCVDVNPDTKPKDLILLANLDSMGSRDYTNSQKAINAYKLATSYGYSQKEAAKLCGTKPNAVTFVSTLIKMGFEDVIEVLENGGKVKLSNMETSSTSLEYITKMAKTLHEETRVVEDTSERIQFSPDAYIKTEKGKKWYYNMVNTRYLDTEVRQLLAELANYKFKEQ